jgi:hypothetical protein
MAAHIFRQIRESIGQLNPNEVREKAHRRIAVRLISAPGVGYAVMEDFLAPSSLSPQKRKEVMSCLYREGDPGAPDHFDLEIHDPNLGTLEGGFAFAPGMVGRILKAREELVLPLARLFEPFRNPATAGIILNISKENALFALATALPDIIPGVMLPWAIPEAASDAAVLTVNQIRMAFLVAAASDYPLGYREQKAEVAAIIAGCFGWRAIARELAGKIPFGGGIIPKGAIAFAGTYVEGLSLERLYRVGYGFSRAERKLAYSEAIDRGRQVAATLLGKVRDD